ncbi:MAG: pyruvate kinase [Dissulfurimicrobium hydrothermale]|uniref:pyruvate kinase n=2 Tax=Dissulfurimicrobium TaxID=1769732 RepID=UPI003C755125
MRRTKIVATLGPATDPPGVLKEMIVAGVDVVRLNFSHGTGHDHRRRAEEVRRIAAELGREVGIMADIPGAKIRITGFADGQVDIAESDVFVLDPEIPPGAGTRAGVGINYHNLAADVAPGDTLLLDDGRIVLQVEKIEQKKIFCRVLEGGTLSGNKGVNRLGGGLTSHALGTRTRHDMEKAVALDADYVAVSFPKCGQDIIRARKSLNDMGFTGGIVAKIECSEALYALDEIIKAADVVMIARGDLGVEIGEAGLPAVQKQIIRQTRCLNRVVITATQMMESMIENPIPTRAEVFDVANAVLDGTDAVMLSAETAVGRFPVKTVRHMAQICMEAEKQDVARTSRHRIDTRFSHIDETLAMSVMYAANHLEVKAISVLTESGKTPMLMSRISSGVPIYALARHEKTLRRMTLFRGVYPVPFDITSVSAPEQHAEAAARLVRMGAAMEGDIVITACGDLPGKGGGTNSMKIVKV